ncbi:MAG: hypothetical protein WD926_02125 [Patescibacteria group bacterium]
MIKNYISDKNYLGLYFNTIGIKFASALVLSFVGAYFYSEGIPLAIIFLYFGAEFLLRAIISPFSGVVTTKLGYTRTVIIANIILAGYFLALSALETYPVIGLSSFVLHSLARGLYYPTKHYMQAKFVREFNRGRFLTLEIVIASLTGAAAVLFATYSVTVWQSFLPVAIAAGLFLMFATLSIALMLGDLEYGGRIRYRDVLKHCRLSSYRVDAKAFTGFGANVAFNNVVVALLVFFVAESLRLFGLIMATVFILEMLLTLAYGRLIDKNRLRSNKVASFLQISSYASFLLAFTPLLVTAIKTAYNIVWNIFDSSFTVRFHSKISRQGLVYACAKEVNLGLAAAGTCFVLAGVAYFGSYAAFVSALVLSSLGVWLAWSQFKD